MSPVIAGLLLPQSTLSQPWFLTFALIVGFNTLIYLGLTVSKLIPWPPQVHPDRVRAILPSKASEESNVNKRSHAVSRELSEPFDVLRYDAARQTIPQAMVLIGAVMLVVAFANLLVYEEHSTVHSLGAMITAFVFIAVSQILVRRRLAAATIITIWTVFMVVIIGEISYYAADRNEPIILVNAVVLLIMLAPISMSWTAAILGSALAGAAVLTSGWIINSLSSLPWAMASASSVTAGLVLLQLRLTVIDRLGLAQLRANALASTDPLTGMFSRTGLLSLAETIASTAASAGLPVHAVVCDIRDLNTVNHNYGMEYGDEALRVTAKALTQAVPQADLVARWDGDSFLALGVGSIADSHELKRSVERGIANSGITLGKQALSVTVQSVERSPDDTSFEELVRLASMGIRAQRAAPGSEIDLQS